MKSMFPSISYLYIYIYIYTDIDMHIHIYTCIYVHVYMHMCIYICIYVDIIMYVYVVYNTKFLGPLTQRVCFLRPLVVRHDLIRRGEGFAFCGPPVRAVPRPQEQKASGAVGGRETRLRRSSLRAAFVKGLYFRDMTKDQYSGPENYLR